MRAVIEASSTGPVVAVGGSGGGTLMMVLAAAYPALVHQLVLIGSHAAPSVTYAQLEWVDEARACLREGHQAQALGIIASAAFSEPGTRHLAETFVESRLHVPTDILLDFLTPNPEDDVVALLPHIQMPTLVIHGTADRYVPFAMGQYLAEHIHGAQFYTLQGKGHGGGLFTATHELCEVLRCFVRTGKVS